MESPTEACRPLCGALGHEYAHLMVWRCQHTGAVTLMLKEWHDEADEAVETHRATLELGPFDTAADADHLVAEFAARVAAMVGGLEIV